MRLLPPGIFVAALLALVASGDIQVPVSAAASPQDIIKVPPVEEPVGEHAGFTYVGRPAGRGDAPLAARSSSFVVTYTGFPPEAQAAFQYAVDIWGSIIQSPVPIRINATFRTDFPGYILGSAGTTAIVANFPNARRANTYYPAALANAMAGMDLVAGDEISANFNANFDWYLGTDGNARYKFDFVTVVLHELGHGLGFFTSARMQDGLGSWGFGLPPQPSIYDTFIANGAGQYMIDARYFPNGSAALGNLFISDGVHFGGNATRAAEAGVPSIFAPPWWYAGSSIAHLSDERFPRGDINSLMTPALSSEEVIHDPGPIATAILTDMGWPRVGEALPGLPPLVTGVRLLGR